MPRIAAIVTEYRVRSHADNIVTRLIEGYELHWTTVRPSVRVAALYTDQVPVSDISRELAARYHLPLYPTIREALTLGGETLAVDGVVLIGEHGEYPYNEKGQHLYPRRRFFEETVTVFRESGRVVPVFNDKHLAYSWGDAKWMYDTARELGIPFMAGSSMPVTPRVPPMQVPYGAAIEEIVVVAHGGLESYGFHALEIGQCLAERRKGHESGVARVQCLTGDAFRRALEEGIQGADGWSRALEDAALSVAVHAEGSVRDHYARRFVDGDRGASTGGTLTGGTLTGGTLTGGTLTEGTLTGGTLTEGTLTEGTLTEGISAADVLAADASARGVRRGGDANEPAIYRVEYVDGLRLTVLMLNGYVTQRGAAVRVSGEATPLAAQFTQARRQPVWHFDHQVDLIERMLLTGRPPYPIERTLLTTGLIDAIMTSRYEGGHIVATPHLAITYAPDPPPPYYERSFVPAGWTRSGPLERRAEPT